MSARCVYTIRIPEEVRKAMDEMKNVNWQSDIGQAAVEIVNAKIRQKLLAEADDVPEKTRAVGISASELIRDLQRC